MTYKIVTLVGGSNTTRSNYQSMPSDEVWTLAYLYPEIEADRVFEMHTHRDLMQTVAGRKRWNDLKTIDVPAYTLEWQRDFPTCVKYPLAKVTWAMFGNLHVGDDIQAHPFGSSLDYMLALAIYEGFARINLFGWDMDESAEYFYQRPGAHLLIGRALAQAEVYTAPGSTLINNRMYGYEGYPRLIGEAAERVEMVLEQMDW